MRVLALLSTALLPACVDAPPEPVAMVGGASECPGGGGREGVGGAMIAVFDGVPTSPWRGEVAAEEGDGGRYEITTLACVIGENGELVATWEVVWFLPDLLTAPLQVVGSSDLERNGFRGTYGRLADGDFDTFGLGQGTRGSATVRAFDPAGILDVTLDVRGVPGADAEGDEVGDLEAALRWNW